MRLTQQILRVNALAARADVNRERKKLLGAQLHDKTFRHLASTKSLVWIFGTGALWAATKGSPKQKKTAAKATTRKLLSVANLTWIARTLMSHRPPPKPAMPATPAPAVIT